MYKPVSVNNTRVAEKRHAPLRDLVLDAAVDVGATPSEPPKRFRLAAYGVNQSAHGPFELRKEDAAEMVARAKRRAIKQHADYEHAGLLAAKNGTKAPASAWYDIELGDDGLYASNIEWTPDGLDDLKHLRYRYISPWFGQRADGSVASFKNFTLTNRPAMDNLQPLVNSEDNASEDEALPPETAKMETLLKTLALAEDATEAQAVAKVNSMNAERDAIFTATGTKDLPSALATIETQKRDAEKAAALEKQLGELKAGAEKKERELVLNEAVEAGAIPPNMKDFWASETMSLEQLKAYVAKAPKAAVKAGAAGGPTEKGLADVDLALTEDDKVTAKAIGISPEDFAKHKKQMLGRV